LSTSKISSGRRVCARSESIARRTTAGSSS
jgi:hypothetical protein